MARPKSNVSTTSTIEKNQVEVAESVTETTENEVVENKETVVEKTEKTKKFGDTDKVTIKCVGFENKSILVCGDTKADFDAEGKATVTGEIAKRLLTIPGYEIA